MPWGRVMELYDAQVKSGENLRNSIDPKLTGIAVRVSYRIEKDTLLAAAVAMALRAMVDPTDRSKPPDTRLQADWGMGTAAAAACDG